MASNMKQLITLTSFIHFAAKLVLTKEITIYDSTELSNLADWTIYPTPSVTDTYTGWLETGASYQRKFQVCQVQSSNQNYWLRTPHIERRGANRIQAELEFSMFSCEGIKNVLSCRETFDFYFIETGPGYNGSTWAAPPYTKIKRIAAEGRFSDQSDEIINTVVEDFRPTTQNGFYLALQDQGACMALLKTRLFYTVCQNVVENFATFPETVTGLVVTSLVPVMGTCVQSATVVGSQQPVYQCQSDGSWTLIQGSCACLPGYEPVDSTCQECIIGTYKHGVSSEPCRPCPAWSHADTTGMTECMCVTGYFRAAEDESSDSCTGPPSAPMNVKAVVKQETSVITLTWSPPMDDGGRSDVTYWIECPQCPIDVKFTPGSDNVNSLEVNISRLSSYTEYTFRIHARNGVSAMSGVDNYAHVNATTFSSVPSSVRDSNVGMSYFDAVSLEWMTPLYPNGEILDYEIRYYIQYMRPTSEIFCLKAPSFGEHQTVIIGDLQAGTVYVFQVRARTQSGFGAYSYPIMGSTLDVEELSSTNVGILAGVLSTVFFLFAGLGAAIIFRFWNGRKKEAPPAHVGIHTLTLTNGELLLPNIGKPRIYVDPSMYGDPDRALREFTTEVDANTITIMEVIGGGEFGDVCSGLMKTPDGYTRKVAVKMLKPGALEKDRSDFLLEASIMGQFDHPNVVKLMGVVRKTRPAMIVTDFMENGAMDSFLRENDGQFSSLQLLGLLRGISCGMRYLAEMNYVHRDLAARNILVDQGLQCRVADFGLSRAKEEGMYESRGGGKIPVRWTAPEAISFKKFTSSSDVWSYGIVTWEVMSYGERPYWNWGNHDVIDAVQKGYSLPPPMDCPECVYELMLDCWERDRLQRPTFSSIVYSLDRITKNPTMLQTKARARDDSLDPISPNLSQFHSVPEWLEGIKMGRYKTCFSEAGFAQLQDIARLTTADLIRMGITLLGHQKKLMKNIELLRQQMILSQATFV